MNQARLLAEDTPPSQVKGSALEKLLIWGLILVGVYFAVVEPYLEQQRANGWGDLERQLIPAK